MFEIGKNYLFFLVSGYAPAVYVGKVVKNVGYGAEIENAVMVHYCQNGQWGQLAEGVNKSIRTNSTFKYAGKVAFFNCSRYQEWQGELPNV